MKGKLNGQGIKEYFQEFLPDFKWRRKIDRENRVRTKKKSKNKS